MKKIISFFLIFLMVLMLCSCKDTSDLDSGISSSITSTSNNSFASNLSSDSYNSSTSNISSTSNNESNNAGVCEHLYTPATCEKPAICELCGAICQEAFGHYFIKGSCSRDNCTAKDPNWVNWYNDGDITITEAEVEHILSMQYEKPKNVIVMIGDGMGANDIELTETNKKGCFDFGLVLNQIKCTGFATTNSNDSKVTDSAASATALATGTKTNNGYIGVSPEGEDLTNISEIARKNGKKVGIVTNDDIVGATPAGFTVHNIYRGNYMEIAESFVNFKPDVLIGQGHSYFSLLNLSRFLVSNTFSEMVTVLNKDPQCKKPFIGFFSEDIKSKMSNTLAYCTEIALNRLKNNDNGFFLMVENAATDKAGHAQDINGKINGVVTFDRAVATVLKFMKNNPDTLLIITSDHETGGVVLPLGNFKLDNSLVTTSNHTGVSVRTFAVGYGATYFHNKTVDNTDIAKFAIDAVKGLL